MRNIKPLLALVVTAIGSAFVATFQVASPQSAAAVTAKATPAPTTTSGSAAGATATAPSTAATAAPSTSATTPTTTTATWTDGTYTGSAVREPWGTFQVKATISGGQLVSVSVVASPSDGHSSRINSAAIPALTQSAIAAQSAEIDAVSGATWTSQSYATSLQAALDAARTTQAAG